MLSSSDQFVASVLAHSHANVHFAFLASFRVLVVFKGLQALCCCITGATVMHTRHVGRP